MEKEISAIAKFLKESVEALKNYECTCCKYNLDSQFAIFVGWSAGYGDAVRDDCIQDPKDPDWAINAGVKVRNDADWADYDWLDFPVIDEEIWDISVSIEPGESWEDTARWLYKSYLDVLTELK